MKKIGVILFLILLVLIPVVLADEKVDKAYSCLEGKVKTKCSSLSSEEQAFSLLALSYNSDIQKECKSALLSSSKDNVCWPKSGCKLRETSLAFLALENIKADTSKIQDWLLNQTQVASDLQWFLEIDSKEASTCKISYDDRNYTVTIQSDKKLSSGAGSCLTLAYSNYWLQINPSCVNKKFSVTCDKDFATALLYKKTNSDVWFVSSQTESESAGGMAEAKVESLCFKQNNVCDYEGSLWATLAISKKQDINKFLPYIIALAPDNAKYNPSAFFYLLTSNDEYLSNVRDLQTQTGFWDLGGYNKFYDTALSLLALQQLNDEQAGKAKDWLLNSQDSAGCWSSLRDTAFLLYAAWPKTPASVTTTETNCEDFGKFCCSNEDCSDAGGEILSQYFCAGMKVCCSKQPVQKTCAQKLGIICKSDETCTGSLGSSSDSSKCCINGDCEKIAEEPECEKQGNNCRNKCLDTEEIDNSLDCNSGFCCKVKQEQSSSAWIWILIIFIILIILVVLAIIFRDKLRLWLFKMKNRTQKGSQVTQTRPPFPPQPPRMMPRPMMRPMPRPMPMQKPIEKKSRTDSELDETLKKLREMSK
ncbi:hypothetical protein FJZ19_00375 [Candidatus Pacearchaeota archaeon]|nr:hypothetical protein [Candidatus Pacearchaeota archaeon]